MQNVNPVGALAGAWFTIMNDVHHKVVGRIFVFGLDLWRQQLAKVDASGGEHDNCQFVAKIVGSFNLTLDPTHQNQYNYAPYSARPFIAIITDQPIDSVKYSKLLSLCRKKNIQISLPHHVMLLLTLLLKPRPCGIQNYAKTLNQNMPGLY